MRVFATLLNDVESYFDDASYMTAEKLIDRINRVKTETTPEQQKGIDFENAIVDVANGGPGTFTHKCDPGIIKQIGGELVGAVFQTYVEGHIVVDEQTFTIYGYVDAIQPHRAVDIKTGKEYDLKKFGRKIQHHVYMYALDQNGFTPDRFDYIITDFKDWFIETYPRDISASRDAIKDSLRRLVDFISVYNDKITNPQFKVF